MHEFEPTGRIIRSWLILLVASACLLVLSVRLRPKGPMAIPEPRRPPIQHFRPSRSSFSSRGCGRSWSTECFKCHGEKKQSNGLRLDSREAALKGGDTGPALVAGKPDESLLVQAVAQTHAELKMPPSGKLPDSAVAALRQWVAQGAPWPAVSDGEPQYRHEGRRRSHARTGRFARSSGRRRRRSRTAPGSRRRVDAFVVARLEAAGSTPSRRASKQNADPPRDHRPLGHSADRRRRSTRSRPIGRPMHSPGWSIGCWRRRDTASAGAGTGWTSPATPTRRAMSSRRTGAIRTPTPTATTSIAAFNARPGFRSVRRRSSSRPISLPSGNDRGPLAAMGFLTVGRRFLLDQNEIIDDRIDVVSARFAGFDGHLRPLPRSQVRSDSRPKTTTRSTASSRARSSRPSCRCWPIPAANPRFADYQKKLAVVTKARDDYLAARRDEFAGDMKAQLSQYLKAAQSLGFRPANAEARRAGAGRRAQFAAAARRDVDLAAARFGRRPEGPGSRSVAIVRRACRPTSSRPRRPSFSER